MAINSISVTGPFIHLSEIKKVELLNSFSSVGIGPAVASELKTHNLTFSNFVQIISPNEKTKVFTNIISLQYEIDLAEAESIALVRQENARLFFTDDLDAREAAKALNVEVHGTIGILLRAFRERKLNKSEAIEKLRELKKSSLFVTCDLIELAIGEVKKYEF